MEGDIRKLPTRAATDHQAIADTVWTARSAALGEEQPQMTQVM